MKQFAVLFLALLITLLALAAGVTYSIEQITTPDSVKTVDYVHDNGITLNEAKSAREMAEANKANAEAQVIATSGFFTSMWETLLLCGCGSSLAIGLIVVLFRIDRLMCKG